MLFMCRKKCYLLCMITWIELTHTHFWLWLGLRWVYSCFTTPLQHFIMREQIYVLRYWCCCVGCGVAWVNDSSFHAVWCNLNEATYIACEFYMAPSNFDGANVLGFMRLWMEVYVLEFTPQFVNFPLCNRCSGKRCGV